MDRDEFIDLVNSLPEERVSLKTGAWIPPEEWANTNERD
jgi:hypothetical protein